MRNIPVDLSGYRLMVSDEPTMKTRRGKDGQPEPVTDANGVIQFVVSLFAKRKGEKGEEIKVTLSNEPGEGINEGDLVSLVDAQVNSYSFTNDRGETVSGIAFKASGLKSLG